MRESRTHDFFQLLGNVKDDLAKQYLQIRSRSREDPGTAGDQAEEDWAFILRQWIPATYHVVTKGRILFPDQTSSPQVDVIVLKPSYPLMLRNQKYYFSGGIVAAFECKLTARSKDIQRFFQTAAAIKRKLKSNRGTPYRELQADIAYGLLAHSHDIPGKQRAHALYDVIEKNHVKYAEHPRELPDVLCIADSATVPLSITIQRPNEIPSDEFEMIERFQGNFLIDSMYVIHDERDDRPMPSTGSILATLIKDLTHRIARRDPSIRDWAEHLSTLGSYLGIGLPQYWNDGVLSSNVLAQLRLSGLSEDDTWSEWRRWVC